MEAMEERDTATVSRAREGDAEAFRVLVERHSRSVFRLAYRMTGNEHDADDVVQDTFLRAYRQLGRFEERAHFGTWLYRIAVNCSLDLMRRRRRHDERSSPLDSELSGGNSLVAENIPAPDRAAFNSELKEVVATALETLSPMERSAFVLRHYEGLSIEEIGGVLGLKVNATKHSIFRAVRKMRRELEPVMRGSALAR